MQSYYALRHLWALLELSGEAPMPRREAGRGGLYSTARTMLRTAAVLLSGVLLSAAHAYTIEGRVVAVLDGDTVTVLDQSKVQHRIRLAQIDAPEIGHGRNKPGQAFGNASKQSLAVLVFAKDVRAECEANDRYGRSVCTIWLGSTDANLEQVRRGMAWVYRRYAHDALYYRAEEEARAAQRGL
jgi:endonuclease YncB( thermonuclease family)